MAFASFAVVVRCRRSTASLCHMRCFSSRPDCAGPDYAASHMAVDRCHVVHGGLEKE